MASPWGLQVVAPWFSPSNRTSGQANKKPPGPKAQEARGGAPRRCPPYISRRQETTNWVRSAVDMRRKATPADAREDRFGCCGRVSRTTQHPNGELVRLKPRH